MTKDKRILGIAIIAIISIASFSVFAILNQVSQIELRVLTYDDSGGVDFQAILEAMQEAADRLVERKLAEGIDVAITIDAIPADDEALGVKEAMDLAAGVAQDVLLINPVNLGDFVEAGYLLPITSYVNNWRDWENYTEGSKANGLYRGEQYTVPTGMWLTGILYRKDVFQSVGLPSDWNPCNWSEIINAAQTIKLNAPDVDIPFETSVGTVWWEDSTVHSFLPFLWGDGGEIYDENNDKWIANSSALKNTCEFYYDAFVRYNLSDTTLNFEPNPYTTMVELFSEGEVGLFVQGAGIWDWEYGPEGDHPMENRDDIIGYAPIPGSGNLGAPPYSAMADSYTYGINAATEYPELAWEFLAEWNTAENLAHICAVGGPVSPRIDVMQFPEYSELPWRAEWTEQIEYSQLYPLHEQYSEVSLLIQRLTERLATGTAVDNALQLFKQELIQTVGEANIVEMP